MQRGLLYTFREINNTGVIRDTRRRWPGTCLCSKMCIHSNIKIRERITKNYISA